MDYIDRIKTLIKDTKNVKQYMVAEAAELRTSTLSEILNRKGGRKFTPEHITKIANFFNVTTDYLYGLESSKFKFIPLIGLAHCGKPQEYDLNGFEPIPIIESKYKQGMYAVKAEGNSMLPKISDGDILYCLFNSSIDDGNIVHYSLNGESGIRKYKMNQKGTIISLVPLNTEYEIITIHHDEYFELKMAKVIGLHRDF